MSGIIGSRLNVRGSGLVSKLGTDGQVLTSAGAGIQSAFEDVVRAREDKDRLINLAEAYQAAEIPKATGEAAKITESAEGFKQGRIARAQGEADGFEAILQGYLQSPDITRKRLYLEAMEEVLPGIKKFILSDSSVLPFLPLDGAVSGTAATTGAGGQQ